MITITKQKTEAGLFCILACSTLWLSMQVMMAVEIWKFHPGPLDDCLDSARRETGDVLHPDYAMNPYYLRLDLDGDSAMEYITILVDESGKVRRGLLVCSSEGKTIFYQGAENRVPIESRASSEGCSDPVESPSPFPTRILKDLVLTENRSSQTISPEPYALLECCEVDGEMVVTKQESSQTIPIGESWYPSSKSELLQNLKYDGVATESVEPAGEGIGSIWELTTTVGFLDGNRFRWVIVTIANCPE